MTLTLLKKHIVDTLAVPLGRREAEATARVLLEDLAGLSLTDILCNGDNEVSPDVARRVVDAARRVVDGTPVQYVVGSALFHGLRLVVTPDVLIPRPETSALVDIVADMYGGRPDLDILDACTGSGAIALALARQLPFARITALDVSAAALDVARLNARRLRVPHIGFVEADIFEWQPRDAESLDIIVSNPPYVLESERPSIDARVLDHEPALALFVPDNDPLRFYRRIALLAASALRPGGRLFFEINPAQAEPLRLLLAQMNFSDIRLCRYIDGRLRFALCQKT